MDEKTGETKSWAWLNTQSVKDEALDRLKARLFVLKEDDKGNRDI
jgi:hypothetical protein